MTTSSPTEVVRAINALRAAGDFDAALALIAPVSLDQGVECDRAQWRRKWAGIVAGVPDFTVTTVRSVEDGEWVANHYTVSGTHTGDFFGRPPTGERFEVTGMDMVRVVSGQLVEHWVVAEPF
ncbi:ester cyclase [Yinghuangia seranimata]|uniref:ester cyclase n=1 Tax=Yinghuangia seranimata TaxID=408067 RepID=UPI00248B4762|nr:ester cyclase [Yinghuangia seranimata]MDI2130057.1 ester cyclase [Yinghuangia seranimata]